MSLRIGHNPASLGAQRNLRETTSQLSSTFARLSSGLRIVTAADDAAGLGVSERMRASLRSLSAAQRNTQDGISLARTAEGALSELSNILVRIRELAVSNYTGTLRTADRLIIQEEFDQLVEEYDRTINNTEFNGIELFTEQRAILVQVGVEESDTVAIKLKDFTGHAPLISSYSLLNSVGTLNIQKAADIGINIIAKARANFGIAENRLESALRSSRAYEENLASAESRIRDADFAVETARLARLSILQLAGVSVLTQANLQPALALELFRSPPESAFERSAGAGPRGLRGVRF